MKRRGLLAAATALPAWAAPLRAQPVGTPQRRVGVLSFDTVLPGTDLTLMTAAGFLLSYGGDLNALVRRAASHVDRILQGARPGVLAIELPSVLELVFYLKTARSLGMRLAPATVQRAGQVIE